MVANVAIDGEPTQIHWVAERKVVRVAHEVEAEFVSDAPRYATGLRRIGLPVTHGVGDRPNRCSEFGRQDGPGVGEFVTLLAWRQAGKYGVGVGVRADVHAG